jgi:hypothetical protein
VSKAENDLTKPIYLMSYPKIVLLYPTFIASIVAGFVALWLGNDASPTHTTLALSFMGILAVNLVVLAFDFPRTTSLTLFFCIVAFVFGFILLMRYFPDLLPAVSQFFKALNPHANSTFYFLFSTVLGIIYVCVFVTVRMDYWEIRSNELLHHHGFLSNLERYSAPNLRISKEIDDIFEYMLMRSGRLIIHPSSEPRAFVLDNVPFIDGKEARITKMLSALQVTVRQEAPLPPQ